ncbi:MAG TPA: branched-chain amino acid ABC transporter permease [Caldimonas sp.]
MKAALAPATVGGEGGRRYVAAVMPWLIGLALFFAGADYLSLWTSVVVMILFALSLDLALGYAGIITLGHAAFFGFGAYTAANMALHVVGDPLAGLAAAALLTGLLGALCGVLILHTQGLTLMMLTLATAAMVGEVGNHARWLTGGDDGLTGIKMAPLFGVFAFDLWGKTAYLYALGVLAVASFTIWRLMDSPFGRSLDGIRQNPARMRAIGTPIRLRLVIAYAISAALAGVAGALQAQVTRTVSLNSTSLLMSGTVLIVLILGGLRRRYGAFAGALVYVLAQNFAAEVDPFRWMFVIGFLLLGVVLFFENGLMGVADSAVAALRRQRRSGVERP